MLNWLNEAIWIVDYRGERLDCDDKVVVREARLVKQIKTWNERTARLFACDCAERALKKYGKNPDPRSLEAVQVARRFSNGKATRRELNAARDAAWAAARDAAWDAAGAARAAARDAAGAARDAAWDAARDAAWDAAGAAAWDAAWDAEYKWQTKRLLEYLEGKR